jgi:cysteinyl-tRNA synthetase
MALESATRPAVDATVVTAVVGLREDLRRAGTYPAADALRSLLAATGIHVQDTPDGPRWYRRAVLPGC